MVALSSKIISVEPFCHISCLPERGPGLLEDGGNKLLFRAEKGGVVSEVLQSRQQLYGQSLAPADMGVDLQITWFPELDIQKLPGKAGKMQGPRM